MCFTSCSGELWKVLAWFQRLSGSFFPSVTSDDSLDLSQTSAKAGKGALHCREGLGSKLRLPGETTAVFWTDSFWDLWVQKVLKAKSLLVSDYEAVAIYSPSWIISKSALTALAVVPFMCTDLSCLNHDKLANKDNKYLRKINSLPAELWWSTNTESATLWYSFA